MNRDATENVAVVEMETKAWKGELKQRLSGDSVIIPGPPTEDNGQPEPSSCCMRMLQLAWG